MSNTEQDWKSRYYDLLSELNEMELGAEKKLQLFTMLVRKLAQRLAMQQRQSTLWDALLKSLQDVPDAPALEAWLEKVDAPLAMHLADEEPLAVAAPAPTLSNGQDVYERLRQWLLEQVQPVMSELKEHPSLADLLEQLQQQDSPDLLEKTLQNLLLVLFEQLGRQNEELVDYLKDLNKHLQVVQRFVDSARVHQNESEQDVSAFTELMQNNMGNLREHVRQAESLEWLKRQVDGRLQELHSHVEDYRVAQDQRAEVWKARYQEMQLRMKRLSTEHQRLQEQVEVQQQRMQTDALTGLPNRVAYELRMQQLLLAAHQNGQPFALLVADLDHFKTINDQYGHLAGDKVLKVIAKTLRSQLRREDMLARIGGEEFVFLLPGLSVANAAQVAEKIRVAASSTGFHFRGSRVQISLSVGVATHRSSDTATQLFERADQALYKAKRSGRNQVCVESGTDKPARSR
ncbi:diguanylate cyclase [Pokkaliibacter sp. MBI-7]|uniref:GGDEF domain-containing protein n=1 Tax=Pokkaliibacter sp. MBI-7 TaxID=3040600 RepID=UPI002447B7FA|nr:diguanylate cyclase [Pokkaliibacter sp. MBI-7]MDH2433527.1 diguanylate cyclase [Pokkaliibacter sp. MBI-7]